VSDESVLREVAQEAGLDAVMEVAWNPTGISGLR
jgi:predicted DsbA family dithiol-disulfide isomerase